MDLVGFGVDGEAGEEVEYGDGFVLLLVGCWCSIVLVSGLLLLLFLPCFMIIFAIITTVIISIIISIIIIFTIIITIILAVIVVTLQSLQRAQLVIDLDIPHVEHPRPLQLLMGRQRLQDDICVFAKPRVDVRLHQDLIFDALDRIAADVGPDLVGGLDGCKHAQQRPEGVGVVGVGGARDAEGDDVCNLAG